MPHATKITSFGRYDIAYLGPPLEHGPLPTFVYFALSSNDSLLKDPYHQPAAHFVRHGWRVFSATLPEHEEEKDPHTAMERWAARYAEGFDLIDDFANEFTLAFSPLIEEWIEDEPLAIGGLSRGGFVAAHVAAKEPRFKSLLCYAPLTDLSRLEEFKETSPPSLKSLSTQLADRGTACYIGNRDMRVGTDSCVEWINDLTEKAYENGVRSPPIWLHLSPSIGRDGHGTSPETFERGVYWVLHQQNRRQDG